MFKKIMFLLISFVFVASAVKYHTDSRGAEIHTPFRWIVADSTARMALSVAAADTQKFCFQLADTTIWVLSDDSPKRWTWVSGKKADSLKIRHTVADSATITVLKGQKTIRDSTIFTGGIKGVRLSMDSIFNLTGTAYRVQGLSPTKKVVDAPIYFIPGNNNITIGKDTMISWNSSRRIIQIGGNTAIMGLATASGTDASHLITNGYNDGSNLKPIADGTVSIFAQGKSVNGWRFYYNSGLTANATYTATERCGIDTSGNGTFNKLIGVTLNTGNGDNELYAMNQNVRTSDAVSFAGVTSNLIGNVTGTADSAKKAGTATLADSAGKAGVAKTLNGGDLLSVYDTGSFACSLFDGTTYRANVTAKYTIIGNVVNLSIPWMQGTLTGDPTSTFLRTLPAAIRPSTTALIATTTVSDNGSFVPGRVRYLSGTDYFLIGPISTLYFSAGTGGLNYASAGSYKFTYTLD